MLRILPILLCFMFSACDKHDDKPILKPEYIGKRYISAKYIKDPLGEGIGTKPDSDPLIRFDAFDCMTFVETSLAGGNQEKLTQIRYANAKIDFKSRNHFFETDWLKNNSVLVSNISDKIAKTKVRHIIVDKQKWMMKTHKIAAKFDKEYSDIKYVAYNELVQTHINNDKPLIVAFVINNPKLAKQIGSDIGVSHIGFLLPNGMLRHASSELGHVADTNFKKYISARAQDKTNLGVAFFKINEYDQR